MTYEACEAALQSLLVSLSGFTNAVTLGDYQKANAGVDRFMVLEYGGFRQVPETMSGFQQVTWTIEIHLLERHDNASNVRDKLREDRQSIINLINAHPRLSGTAFDAFLVRGSKGNEEVVMGQVRFFEEILYAEVSEDLEISPLD